MVQGLQVSAGCVGVGFLPLYVSMTIAAVCTAQCWAVGGVLETETGTAKPGQNYLELFTRFQVGACDITSPSMLRRGFFPDSLGDFLHLCQGYPLQL
jgi:hypothetical protein